MGLSQLFEISLVNVSWSNLGLARPWRCIVRFLLLPESCRRVGSARSLVGGGVGNEVLIPEYDERCREALARILAGRRGGREGFLGDKIRRTTALGALSFPRENKQNNLLPCSAMR